MNPEETARLYLLLQIAGFVTVVAGGFILIALLAAGA